MSQGQGLSTRRKEERFAAALSISLGVSKAESVKDQQYYHIDLNCGSGWNETSGCEGSPMVFMREANAADRRYRATFCDSNLEYTSELMVRLNPFREGGGYFEILTMDNGEALGWVADTIRSAEMRPELAIGSLICDPNGPKTGYPAEALKRFSAEFRRIDLILNVNMRVWRSAVGARDTLRKQADCRPCFKGFADWPDLQDSIAGFGKETWMVSNPLQVQGDCFSVFYGTNAPIARRSFQGFYSLESREGRQIMERMGHVNVGQQHFPWMEA